MSVLKPWGPSNQSLSQFSQHKAIRRLTTSPPPSLPPPHPFTGTHLYSWVEMDTVRESILLKNTMTQLGVEPRPLDLKVSHLQ